MFRYGPLCIWAQAVRNSGLRCEVWPTPRPRQVIKRNGRAKSGLRKANQGVNDLCLVKKRSLRQQPVPRLAARDSVHLV